MYYYVVLHDANIKFEKKAGTKKPQTVSSLIPFFEKKMEKNGSFLLGSHTTPLFSHYPDTTTATVTHPFPHRRNCLFHCLLLPPPPSFSAHIMPFRAHGGEKSIHALSRVWNLPTKSYFCIAIYGSATSFGIKNHNCGKIGSLQNR